MYIVYSLAIEQANDSIYSSWLRHTLACAQNLTLGIDMTLCDFVVQCILVTGAL